MSSSKIIRATLANVHNSDPNDPLDRLMLFGPDGLPITREALLASGGVPSGGTAGQALIKQSPTDGDASWETLPSSGMPLAINPRDPGFGAAWDGVTDAAGPINSALASFSGASGKVFLPAGDIRIATGLVGQPRTHLEGAGKGVTQLILDDVASVGIGLNVGVSATASPLLIADLNRGDRTATVASVTGLTVGETVLIKAAQVAFGAWMAKIIDITGQVVTFDESSPVTFTVADSAQLFRYPMFPEFRLAHMTIRTSVPVPTARKILTQFERAVKVEIEDVEFLYAGSVSAKAIYATTCRDFRVSGCDVEGIKADDTALAMSFQRVTDLSVIDNKLRDVSAGIVAENCPKSVIAENEVSGAGTASGGRAIKLMDQSNDSSICNNTVSDFATDHTAIRISDLAYSVVKGNIIRACGSGIDMNTDASPTRALTKHNVIEGNVISDCVGWAIDHQPNGAATTDMFNLIKGNRIHNCTLGGISIGTCGNVIDGNLITDYGAGTGIKIQSSSNVRNLIQRNYIRNPSTPGTGKAISSQGGNMTVDNDIGSETSTFSSATDAGRALPRLQVVTQAASMIIDPSSANNFKVSVNDATAHSFGAPLGGNTGRVGQRITIDVFNNTAGAIATTTWSGAFKLAGAWVSPAAGKHRIITFQYDGASWLEHTRTAADV